MQDISSRMDAVCRRFEELSMRLNQPDAAAETRAPRRAHAAALTGTARPRRRKGAGAECGKPRDRGAFRPCTRAGPLSRAAASARHRSAASGLHAA